MIYDVEIVTQRKVATDCYRLDIYAPEVAAAAQPGQFLMVKTSFTLDPLLRRPLSINTVDRTRGLVKILYRVVGRGTSLMAGKKLGRRLSILGPLGNGFTVPSKGNFVVVAGGLGIAPLFFLVQRLRALGNEVAVFYGAQNRFQLLLIEELNNLRVNLFTATNNGSSGHKGTVVDLLRVQGIPPAEIVYAAGPPPMLRALSGLFREAGVPRAEITLEERMGCGVGACRGCAVRIAGEEGPVYKRVCADGPVFRAEEVIWE
ncbi:MAG: dihydroorotate dehydrogenase electron transfer subunit [Bacillota bacterium]